MDLLNIIPQTLQTPTVPRAPSRFTPQDQDATRMEMPPEQDNATSNLGSAIDQALQSQTGDARRPRGEQVENVLRFHAEQRQPTPWRDVVGWIRNFFPGVSDDDLGRYETRYNEIFRVTHQANVAEDFRRQAQQQPNNPLAPNLLGSESAAGFMGRRAVPVSSAVYGFGMSRAYTNAMNRLRAGQAEAGDYRIIAEYERSQTDEENRDFGSRAVAGLAHVPALVGEAMLGGAMLGGGGAAAAPAAAEAPALLSRAGLSALGGEIAANVGRAFGQEGARTAAVAWGRNAAQTALMPSMYLENWAQRAAQAGRDPATIESGIRDLPTAFGLGFTQVAVLGSLGRIGNNIPGTGVGPALTRLATRTATGVTEQQGVDVVTSFMDEFLPATYQFRTRYGVLGNAVRGEWGLAGEHLALQAITFAAFSALHPVLHGEPAADRAQRALARFGEVIDRMEQQGVNRHVAADRVGRVYDFVAETLTRNPDISRTKLADLAAERFKGPEAEAGRAIAETLPDHQAPQGPEPGIDRLPEPPVAQPTSQMPVNAPGSRPGQSVTPEASRPVEGNPSARAQAPARQPQAPRHEQSSTPIDPQAQTVADIKAGMAGTAEGIKAGAREKADQYARRIMAGEKSTEVLKGFKPGGAMVEAVKARLAELKNQSERLPRELSGAKPRYSYRDAQFELKFESDIDKAAYISAQKKPSRADAQYVEFVKRATGMTEMQIRELGRRVRDHIKTLAKDSNESELTIARQWGKPHTSPKIIADAVLALISMDVQPKAAQIQIERAAEGKAFTDVGELVKAAFFKPELAPKKPTLEQLHEKLPTAKKSKPAKSSPLIEREQASEWYYADKEGKQRGPLTMEELSESASTGSVTAETMVWKEGSQKTPAMQIPQLAILKTRPVEVPRSQYQKPAETERPADYTPEQAKAYDAAFASARRMGFSADRARTIGRAAAEEVSAQPEVSRQTTGNSPQPKADMELLWAKQIEAKSEATREAINRAGNLTKEEADALWARLPRGYGGEELSMRKAGERLGINYETVRKLETSAREKLGIAKSAAKIKELIEGSEKEGRKAAQKERGVTTKEETKSQGQSRAKTEKEDAVQDDAVAKLEAIKKEGRQPTVEEAKAILQEWADQRTKAEPLPPTEYRQRGGTMGEGPLEQVGPNRTLATANRKMAEIRDAEQLKALQKQAAKGDEKVWQEAREALAKDAGAGTRIAQEVVSSNGKRAINEVESAMIEHRMISVRNEIRQLERRLETEGQILSDVMHGRLARKLADLRAERDMVDQASTLAGSVTARTLRFRRQLIHFDYSLGNLLYRAEKAKRGELTKGEKAEIEKLQAELEAAKEQLRLAEEAGKVKPGEGSEEGFITEQAIIKIDVHINRIQEMNETAAARHTRLAMDIWNLPRQVKASIDSFLGRQGWVQSMIRPGVLKDVVPETIKAFGSEKSADRVMYDLMRSEDARSGLYDEMRINFSDTRGTTVTREEGFRGGLIERAAESNIPLIRQAAQLIKASERSHSAGLNVLRGKAASALAGTLGKHASKDGMEILGHWVNVSTHRPTMPRVLERAAELLNGAFFSPRSLWSKMLLMSGEPIWHGLGTHGLQPRARLIVAGEYARFMAGNAVVWSLAAAAGFALELDRRSSDFGKIKIGNTRIDITGGLGSWLTFASRMWNGQTKTQAGEIRDLHGPRRPYGGDTMMDVIARFGRGKLAPTVGAGLDLVTREQAYGEPATVSGEALDLVTPIFVDDVIKSSMDLGMPRALVVQMLALAGVSVNTYTRHPRALQR